jgi:hypothetical protein
MPSKVEVDPSRRLEKFAHGRTPGGAPVAEAYPAKLERALRASGWDVSVSKSGDPRRYGARCRLRHRYARAAGYERDNRSIRHQRPPSPTRTRRRYRAESRGDHPSGPRQGQRRHPVRQWPASDAAIFAAAQQSVDSFVTRYSDVYYEVGRAAGGGSDLNTIPAITRT